MKSEDPHPGLTARHLPKAAGEVTQFPLLAETKDDCAGRSIHCAEFGTSGGRFGGQHQVLGAHREMEQMRL